MIIGVPKEVKDHEGRVALLPEAVQELVKKGHDVLVQKDAGRLSGFSDQEYRRVGARIVATIQSLYKKSELVLKVKEPLPQEYPLLRRGLLLFCYLHLAANKKLTARLMKSGVTALGFETLEDKQGRTPLLKPMSEIAGRLSTVLGTHYLRTDQGGKGILLSPTDYSEPGRVVVIGGGNVGRAASEVAAGLGAKVQVLDLHPKNLSGWIKYYPEIEVIKSSPKKIAQCLSRADLVVAAVYIPGARTPKIITRKMVQAMQSGSVLVDVAVDQGGVSETTRPTSLSKPTYLKYGIIHCAVPNLPALVSRTASRVLSRVILPYVLKLAKLKDASHIIADPNLRTAVNVSDGVILHPQVLASFK